MLTLNTDWKWCPSEVPGTHEADPSYWICEPLPGVLIFLETPDAEVDDPHADRNWRVVLRWGEDSDPIYNEFCPGTAKEVKAYLLSDFGQDLLVMAAQLIGEPTVPVLKQLHSHEGKLLGLDTFGRVWERRGRIWERIIGSLM